MNSPIEHLATFLRAQQQRLIAHAKSRGISDTLYLPVELGKATSSTSSTFTTGFLPHSPLFAGELDWESIPEIDDWKGDLYRNEAKYLCDKCRIPENLKLAPIMHVETREEKVALMIRTFVSRFLRRPDWDVGDNGAAVGYATQCIEQLTRGGLTRVTLVPFAAPFATHTLSIGTETLFRPLSDREMGSLNHSLVSRSPFNDLALASRGMPSIATSALELRTTEQDEDVTGGMDWPMMVISAMQIHGVNVHGPGTAIYWIEPSPVDFRGSYPLSIPAHGVSDSLTQGRFQDVVRLAQSIRSIADENPQGHQVSAIRRFHTSMARTDPRDSVVDISTILETLLLDEQDRTELGYKFKIRGAYFLAASSGERGPLAEKLKLVYAARSAAVHGTTASSMKKSAEVLDVARDLVRSALLKCLSEGWCNPAELDRTILSGG